MTVGNHFRRLTRAIRRLEREGWEIETVSPTTGVSCYADGSLGVEIVGYNGAETDIRTNGGAIATDVADERASAWSPGEIVSELSSVSCTHQELDIRADGVPRFSLRLEIGKQVREAEKSPTASPGTPLHRDADRLRELYQHHGTFAEMANAVDRDVSGETIRRYTIEHGIHSAGEPVAPTDEASQDPVTRNLARHGVDHEMTVDRFLECVARARTIHDLQRSLGLDRSSIRELLEDLGLLAFVIGRMETAEDRLTSVDEVKAALTTTNR